MRTVVVWCYTTGYTYFSFVRWCLSYKSIRSLGNVILNYSTSGICLIFSCALFFITLKSFEFTKVCSVWCTFILSLFNPLMAVVLGDKHICCVKYYFICHFPLLIENAWQQWKTMKVARMNVYKYQKMLQGDKEITLRVTVR